MVNSHFPRVLAAVKAPELVPPEDLLFGEFYTGAGAFDDVAEADNRRFWIVPGHSSNYTASVHDHIGFANQNQAHRPARGADVDWCIITV